MLEFECRHVVEGCVASVRDESFEDLWLAWVDHAAEFHGVTDPPPETRELLHANVTSVDL